MHPGVLRHIQAAMPCRMRGGRHRGISPYEYLHVLFSYCVAA